jgi:DNA-binding NarL/FixJ family response regulator
MSQVLPDGLTAREADVLALIADGYSNSDIAEVLFLSTHTVETHVNRIFARTHSQDRAQAILCAQDRGLAPRSDTPK